MILCVICECGSALSVAAFDCVRERCNHLSCVKPTLLYFHFFMCILHKGYTFVARVILHIYTYIYIYLLQLHICMYIKVNKSICVFTVVYRFRIKERRDKTWNKSCATTLQYFCVKIMLKLNRERNHVELTKNVRYLRKKVKICCFIILFFPTDFFLYIFLISFKSL